MMTIQVDKKNFFWINLVWFQVIWFLAILYTQQANVIMAISLCFHFLFTPTRSSDLRNLIFISSIGICADYFLTAIGILNFNTTTFIPLWLILLWCHFSLTLSHSMLWLSKLALIARILFGAFFGTLSYYTATQLNDAQLHQNLILSLFSLAVIWGVLLPVYISMASHNRKRCDEIISGNIQQK